MEGPLDNSASAAPGANVARRAVKLTDVLGSNPFYRYSFAAIVVAATVVVRSVLNPLVEPHAPYMPFALAILFVGRFAGRGPALSATALSTLGVVWFFLRPIHSLAVDNPAAIGGLALFVVVGVLISVLIGDLRDSLLRTASAEAALRSEAELIDLSHDAIIQADANRVIKGWNVGALEMYGWSESEAVGKSMHNLLQTRSQAATAEIDNVLSSDGRWDGELVHTARDGRRVVTESRQVLLRDDSGAATGILEINRDITGRKQVEEDLRDSEEKFRTLANAMPPLCWMADKDGWIFWYNERWHEYTGTRPEEMEGWGWQSVHDPEVLPSVLEHWKASIATGMPFDMVFPLRGADGVFRPFLTRAMPMRDQEGEVTRWFGTNVDISEQRKTEEALRDALEQRGLALEAAHLGAWDYHFVAGEVFWDDRCRSMFGIASTEGHIDYSEAMSRIHAEDLAATDVAVNQAIAGSNDGAYDREFRVVWPDGSVHWIASHGRVLFEGDGDQRHAVRFAGVNSDITERKRAEERLREMQKWESVGLLAGGIAHDFNNILTVIIGSASLALAECPWCKNSQSVLTAAERATYLTRQLMAYAGKGFTATRLVDFTALVSRSSALLSTSIQKRVCLNFDLSNDLPLVESDPSQIEQVLMNLVINAGEAVPAKTDGLIEVKTSRCEVTAATARRHSRAYDVAAGAYVCLEVRDNGAGMDEATASRVFDPFFTTKFTGRGLGLAAVGGIVRAARGFIEVHSSLGHGATFRVYFPASTKKLPRETPRRLPKEHVRGSATVLVVDDEEMVRKLACLILRRHGYEAEEAEHGKDALRLLADCSPLPSVVLLDLAMPVMGGDELAPILKEKYPDMKIILSSGYPEEETRRIVSGNPIDGFLQKPYSDMALVEKIAQVLA